MKRQGLNKRRVVVGITGSFGSGKTTVARIFRASGFRVINADRIAHEVIKSGSRTYKKLIEAFGRDILSKDAKIDRNRLARLAFRQEESVGILNKIIHPEVIKKIKKKLRICGNRPIILDAPLLIEAGLKRLVDSLIVVRINRKEQVKRLLKKTSLSKAEILRRIRLELPLRDKIRLADFVIDNSATLDKTRKQVEVIRRKLWKN